MPELPEVQTTVNGLQKVLNRTFVDVWTDNPKIIKEPSSFDLFKKQIEGKKIKKIWRRGKNIIFDLSDGYSMLTHLKMTGHFLYDKWNEVDSYNKYIRVKFTLDNGKILALSDLRKFAKVILASTQSVLEELSSLGPEPLEKGFTFEVFKNALAGKKGIIKKILHDQNIIVGIGNIYSDEILWKTKVHPFRKTNTLNERELKEIYKATKDILRKALQLGGTSTSDYRNIEGERGSYEKVLKVYRREGKECSRCKTIIERKKIGARSTCFCPKCQKI